MSFVPAAASLNKFFDQYFDFEIISDNFGYVWNGFEYTLLLSVVGAFFALSWGLILAVLRQSQGNAMRPVRWLTIGYIDVMRGIPLLLVVLLISGSLPFLGLPEEIGIPQFFGLPDPFWYGVLALTLTYGAYFAEVYRAGIEGIPYGQTEAARSLGMTQPQAMRFVIVPQAVRRVIPPLLNDFIALMKDTSLISVIGLVEVVRAGREVQSTTFNSSALMLGAFLFIVVTIPLARLVDVLIKRQQSFQRRAHV